MSIRPKFLYMLVLALMAVTFLFVGYGMLDMWREQIMQRKAIAELAARLIERNIGEEESVAAGVASSTKELSHLGIFVAWVVTDTNINALHKQNAAAVTDQTLRVALIDTIAQGKAGIAGLTVTAPLRKDGKVVGALWAQLDRTELRKTFPPKPMESLIIIMILAVGFIMLIIYSSVSARLLRPIEKLADGAKRVGKGDYSTPVRAPGARGEVDNLIDSFNDMVAEIRELRTGLESKVEKATEKVVEQERQLAAAQRLAATGQLASGVAHEINNPLGGMLNALRKLRDGTLSPEKTDQYMELVKEGLDSIKETVSKLLHFAPRESKTEPLDLSQSIAGAVALTEHYAEEHNVQIVPKIGIGCCIDGDPGEIKQVIVNLLMNAIDAAEGGEVTVRTALTNNRVSIEVGDNGVGMTDEEITKAFEPFHTSKERGRGSGLGLPIVSNIVERHAGIIEVRSEPGRGTTVLIVFQNIEKAGPSI